MRRSTEFTANANGKVNELAVTNTTVYAGGRFTLGQQHAAQRARRRVDGTTGAVRSDFVNNITGGIGTNGELAVQRLKLTRDEGRLLVVHTGRQVNGQDRYGIAMINTRTNKLLPWRTTPVGGQPAVRRWHPAHLRRRHRARRRLVRRVPAAPVATGRRSTTL